MVDKPKSERIKNALAKLKEVLTKKEIKIDDHEQQVSLFGKQDGAGDTLLVELFPED